MEKCVLCGSKKSFKLFESHDKNIVRCAKCGLARTENFTFPKYGEYYRDEVYSEFEEHFRNIFKKRFNLIKRFKNLPGKVLDIGTSTGVMLDIFKEKSWETWGVEPSKSAKVASSKGHKILKGNFEKLDLPENYFDVVILNHTLEHLENPLFVVRKVKKVLKKGGILFVDVPNFGSLSARISKQYWKLLLPEEHIFHFDKKSLKKLFNKSGFRVIYSGSRSGIFDEANPFFHFYYALRNRKISLLFDILDVPTNFLATILNSGNVISMIGKK
jgi:SAM-dependent methyltransferase